MQPYLHPGRWRGGHLTRGLGLRVHLYRRRARREMLSTNALGALPSLALAVVALKPSLLGATILGPSPVALPLPAVLFPGRFRARP
jgi:hypothetical protein